MSASKGRLAKLGADLGIRRRLHRSIESPIFDPRWVSLGHPPNLEHRCLEKKSSENDLKSGSMWVSYLSLKGDL